MTHNFILIENETGVYIAWSNAKKMPESSEPDKWHFEKWGKTLPFNIDELGAKYQEGNFVDIDGNIIELPVEPEVEE